MTFLITGCYSKRPAGVQLVITDGVSSFRQCDRNITENIEVPAQTTPWKAPSELGMYYFLKYIKSHVAVKIVMTCLGVWFRWSLKQAAKRDVKEWSLMVPIVANCVTRIDTETPRSPTSAPSVQTAWLQRAKALPAFKTVHNVSSIWLKVNP